MYKLTLSASTHILDVPIKYIKHKQDTLSKGQPDLCIPSLKLNINSANSPSVLPELCILS